MNDINSVNIGDIFGSTGKQHSLIASFIEKTPDIICFKDGHGRWLEANTTCLELLGLSHIEYRGRDDEELALIAPFYRNIFKNNRVSDRYALQKKIPVRHKVLVRKPDGSQFVFDILRIPLFHDDGRPRGIITVGRDDTLRDRVEREHQMLIDDLMKKFRELEKLTLSVPHDLKNPVITIKSFIRLIIENVKSGNLNSLEEDLLRIEKAACRLENLTEDLIKLTKSGRAVSDIKLISMHQLAQESVQHLHNLLEETGAVISIQEDISPAMGDPVRITQVLLNLIENAVKYSSPARPPRIKIGSCRHNGEQVYFIKDNGMGIGKKDIEKIFELYNQVDCSSRGCGLGLALVKSVIEAHGGHIWAESAGKNRGTTFYFSLPSRGLKAGNVIQ